MTSQEMLAGVFKARDPGGRAKSCIPEGLAEPPVRCTGDPELATESIRRLSQLTFGRACFGHGDPVLESASALIGRLVESF